MQVIYRYATKSTIDPVFIHRYRDKCNRTYSFHDEIDLNTQQPFFTEWFIVTPLDNELKIYNCERNRTTDR